MRQRSDGTGVYVIAATVLDPADADALRPVIAGLVKGRERFHWRAESQARQRKAIGVVAALDAIHAVAVGTGLVSAKQERGRRQCLERLLWELEEAGVVQIWLDARSPGLNRRDIALVASLRAKGVVSESLRVGFAHPFNGRDGEVLLWLPDIVAGAVSAARGDGNDQFLLPIERLVTEFLIELR